MSVRRSAAVVVCLPILLIAGCSTSEQFQIANGQNTPTVAASAEAGESGLDASKKAVTDAAIGIATTVRGPQVKLVSAGGAWTPCGTTAPADPSGNYRVTSTLLRSEDADIPPGQKMDPLADLVSSDGWKVVSNTTDAELGDVVLSKGDLTAEVLTHGIQQVTITVTGPCLTSSEFPGLHARVPDQIEVP